LRHEVCYSAQQTSDDGYILAGQTGVGYCDIWLIKTNEYGDSLWSRTFGGTHNDLCYSVEQTSDGGYILAGQTRSFGAGWYDMWLIKTDEHGDSLWSRTFGGTENDGCESVQQTSDGGYILGGWTESLGPSYDEIWLLKTDANGDSLWSRIFSLGREDNCYSVKQTSDGGFILAGCTKPSTTYQTDIWILKTDENGDSLWSRTLGGRRYIK